MAKTDSSKKPPKQCKPHGPSVQTRWAYWMQAIEPTSEAINKAFPKYHPQWVIQSQRMTIAPENFRYLRKFMLCLSVDQCAAYLRVSRYNIGKWEAGVRPIPFMAFELLRLVYESAQFRLSHPEWGGWFISRDGALVSPDIGGLCVMPDEINRIPAMLSENGRLQVEGARLRAELQVAHEENERLRELFVSQGAIEEITAMQERLTDLLARINTAKVYPFNQERKTA